MVYHRVTALAALICLLCACGSRQPARAEAEETAVTEEGIPLSVTGTRCAAWPSRGLDHLARK